MFFSKRSVVSQHDFRFRCAISRLSTNIERYCLTRSIFALVSRAGTKELAGLAVYSAQSVFAFAIAVMLRCYVQKRIENGAREVCLKANSQGGAKTKSVHRRRFRAIVDLEVRRPFSNLAHDFWSNLSRTA